MAPVSSTSPTDLIDVDPLLEPLVGDPSGATPTHAISRLSPALNAVPAAACVNFVEHPLAVDQRGVARPQEQACDVGAFEFELEPTAITDVDEPAYPVKFSRWHFLPIIIK